MPTTKNVTLPGPEGHQAGTETEWDYDRAGGAYAFRCECGWQSASHWSYKEAMKEFEGHIEFLERQAKAEAMSDEELGAALSSYADRRMGGRLMWGGELLLEAARRLAP